MSLLMDALKRAEQNKQQAIRGSASSESAIPLPADPLSLEPIPSTPGRTGGKHLPELSPHLDKVDEELAGTNLPAEAQPLPAPTTPRTSDQAERDAIRNAFSAKQPPTTPSRLPLWLTLGGLALAAAAIGAYFWLQLNSLSASSLAPVAARHPGAPVTAINPVTVPSSPTPLGPPTEKLSEPDFRPAAQNSPQAFSPRRPLATAGQRPATGEHAAPDAKIRLTASRVPVDPVLLGAHANLRAGKFEQASLEFEKVLQRDPNNTDALLSLATIAQYQGKANDAEAYRQRAWVADPADPAVQAALLGSNAGRGDPQSTETRLKGLLAAQPESAALNFALGNLMAGQKRWSEAQQAYFNAVAADVNNPDYLFNLAISLDQLRQTQLAARHYRMALDAAGSHPTAFDRDVVRKRLSELQP